VALALVLLLAAALALRGMGVPYGFPLLVNSDEKPILAGAIGMLGSGDPNPHFFHYPSLYLYLQAAAFAVVYGVGKLAGAYAQLADLKGLTLPVTGRVLTVLLGTGTVLATFLAGRLLLGPWAALLAAAIVAACRLHVAHSFQIAVDVPAGLFTALALWAAARRFTSSPRWRDYALAGVFAGLATGTKYTAFLAVLPLLWAHFAGPEGGGPERGGPERGGIPRALRDRRLWGALALVPVVFLLTTPYAVLDFATFREHLSYEGAHYAGGHPGMGSGGTSYGAYLSLLWRGAGPAAVGLAVLGAGLLLWRRPRLGGLLLLFPACYLLFIGRYPVHFERNLIPLVPFLALLAAAAVAEPLRGWAAAGRTGTGRARGLLAAGVVLAGIGLAGTAAQGAASLAHVRRVTLPDTRFAALTWARSHVPPGARILLEAHTPTLEQVLRDGRPAYATTRLGGAAASLPAPVLARFDYLVLSSATYRRFVRDPERHPEEAARYRTVFETYPLAAEFAPEPGRRAGPVIRIYRVPR
jgi:hypothetical protein